MNPDDDLLASAQYSATLNSGIVDTDGNALEQYQWDFYTDGNGWSEDELIESDDLVNASAPQINFDSNGNAIAVWEYGNSIYANRFNATTTSWATAELIETLNSTNPAPQIGIDSDDNVIIVWKNSDSIYAKRFDASTGTWTPAELIENGGGSVYDPQVSVNADGNAFAIFEKDNSSGRSIYVNQFTASTATWGTAELIETGTGNADQPKIQIDANGNAIAAWRQTDGTEYSAYTNRYDASTTTWSTAELLETDSGHASDPQISTYANGNAIVVWSLNVNLTGNVYAKQYTASTASWDTAKLISTGTGGPYDLQISSDASGNAVVVWAQVDGNNDNIYANQYSVSTDTWATPELIETEDGYVEYVHLSTDANGNAIALWHIHDSTTTERIYANRYSVNSGSWATAELIKYSDENLRSPKISTDADGNALTVWVQSDGTRDNIHSARFNPNVVAP